MLLINSILYIVSFVCIWIGSGLIVNSINKFSQKIKFSRFAASFIVLGLLTSTPEFAVGMQSLADKDPEIFVGNLLGGITVIFLFVIPLLAILGNGINLKNELNKTSLIACLVVILAPSVLILDKIVTNMEGVIMIVLYFFLLLVVERQHGIFDKKNIKLFNFKAYSNLDILKLLSGVGIVFISSNVIVEKTMFFANWFQISAFYISLIAVSLGTNLPELSLAIRSVVNNKKDIAMGDYMGSAAVNTLLFGIFTLLTNGEVLTGKNFFITFVFIATALSLFYVFSRSKNRISRREGYILLAIYIVFAIVEFSR